MILFEKGFLLNLNRYIMSVVITAEPLSNSDICFIKCNFILVLCYFINYTAEIGNRLKDEQKITIQTILRTFISIFYPFLFNLKFICFINQTDGSHHPL